MKKLFYLIPVFVLVLTVGIIQSCIDKHRLSSLLIESKLAQRISSQLFKDGTALSENLYQKKKDFDKVLVDLKNRDERISRLLKESSKQNYKIKTVTKIQVQVVPKTVYVYKEKSDSTSGSKYTKNIFYKFKTTQMKIASVSFDTASKTWDYSIIPFTLDLVIFRSVKKGYLPKYTAAANLLSNNKRHPIAVSSFKTRELLDEKPSWSFRLTPFSIHFSIMASFSTESISYSLAVSSYLFKLYDLNEIKSFQFLGLGVGYTSPNIFSAYFFPVSFNLNSFIPIIKNTYTTIGLGFNYDISNSRFFLSGVVGLSFEF